MSENIIEYTPPENGYFFTAPASKVAAFSSSADEAAKKIFGESYSGIMNMFLPEQLFDEATLRDPDGPAKRRHELSKVMNMYSECPDAYVIVFWLGDDGSAEVVFEKMNAKYYFVEVIGTIRMHMGRKSGGRYYVYNGDPNPTWAGPLPEALPSREYALHDEVLALTSDTIQMDNGKTYDVHITRKKPDEVFDVFKSGCPIRDLSGSNVNHVIYNRNTLPLRELFSMSVLEANHKYGHVRVAMFPEHFTGYDDGCVCLLASHRWILNACHQKYLSYGDKMMAAFYGNGRELPYANGTVLYSNWKGKTIIEVDCSDASNFSDVEQKASKVISEKVFALDANDIVALGNGPMPQDNPYGRPEDIQPTQGCLVHYCVNGFDQIVMLPASDTFVPYIVNAVQSHHNASKCSVYLVDGGVENFKRKSWLYDDECEVTLPFDARTIGEICHYLSSCEVKNIPVIRDLYDNKRKYQDFTSKEICTAFYLAVYLYEYYMNKEPDFSGDGNVPDLTWTGNHLYCGARYYSVIGGEGNKARREGERNWHKFSLTARAYLLNLLGLAVRGLFDATVTLSDYCAMACDEDSCVPISVVSSALNAAQIPGWVAALISRQAEGLASVEAFV